MGAVTVNSGTMNDDLVPCLVTVPEWHLGVAAGELNRVGAVLDDRVADGTNQIIKTRIPRLQVSLFRIWLLENTDTGRVYVG